MPLNDTLAQENWNRYQYCRDNGHESFLAKAIKCDDFFVGNQWPETDLALLSLQKRPAITINKILSTVGNILGEQIQNRTEVLFRPKNGSPEQTADALTKMWMHVSQENQLPWTRSDVFCDGLIRSRGFFDMRLKFTDSMMGELEITKLNSKNVVIDPHADDYDPDKWNEVFVTKWLSTQEIATLYSEDDAELLKNRARGDYKYGIDSIERDRDTFAGKIIVPVGYGNIHDKAGVERTIRTIDRQYRKLDKQLHFVDVETGDMRPVPVSWDRNKIADVLSKTGGRVSTMKKLVRRIRWLVTADNVVLHDAWSPYKHLTTVPYFPHFRYGKTMGVVENLLGPQEILNKVSSQELHIVNTTANSGWVVEQNSLVNMTVPELEQNGATTGLVIEHVKGSLPPTKIQPNQTPTGLDRISYKAEEHIKSISGVSDSMQGFDREDVAAKAIAYKTQRGNVNNAKVIDNLERTDYILARNAVDIIQEFYTEARIVNITHSDVTREAEVVKVNQYDPATETITNDLTMGEYDITVTSSPYRASIEDSQFEQGMAMKEAGIAIPDEFLIENSRLSRRAELIKTMKGDKDSPEFKAQQALKARQDEATVAALEADVGAKQADTNLKNAKAQTEGTDNGQAELELEREKQAMELRNDMIRMQAELKQMREEMQMKAEAHQQDMAIKSQQAAQDAQIKEQNAVAERATKIRLAQQQEEAGEPAVPSTN